jgi:hypothetical protein
MTAQRALALFVEMQTPDAISTAVVWRACRKRGVLTFCDDIDWKLDCCLFRRFGTQRQTTSVAE